MLSLPHLSLTSCELHCKTDTGLFGFCLSCNIGGMRYVHQEARLSSGERVLSQGINVIGAR